VPALVQTLKTGGPLTLARSLATLAALIQHVPKAGAAVVKAHGIVPILRIAQTGSEELREAAVAVLDAFHVREAQPGLGTPSEEQTCRAIMPALDLLDPMIRALSIGPVRAKVFALRVLRIISWERRPFQALRRPAVTDFLIEFAAAEDVEIASAAMVIFAVILGRKAKLGQLAPEDAAYRALPGLRGFYESLPSRLQSPHQALVLASLRCVSEMCGTPGVDLQPWFRQCIRDIPRLVESGSHDVKVWGMTCTARAWLDRYALTCLDPATSLSVCLC
jgi:hypothetical protein